MSFLLKNEVQPPKECVFCLPALVGFIEPRGKTHLTMIQALSYWGSLSGFRRIVGCASFWKEGAYPSPT